MDEPPLAPLGAVIHGVAMPEPNRKCSDRGNRHGRKKNEHLIADGYTHFLHFRPPGSTDARTLPLGSAPQSKCTGKFDEICRPVLQVCFHNEIISRMADKLRGSWSATWDLWTVYSGGFYATKKSLKKCYESGKACYLKLRACSPFFGLDHP